MALAFPAVRTRAATTSPSPTIQLAAKFSITLSLLPTDTFHVRLARLVRFSAKLDLFFFLFTSALILFETKMLGGRRCLVLIIATALDIVLVIVGSVRKCIDRRNVRDTDSREIDGFLERIRAIILLPPRSRFPVATRSWRPRSLG